MMVFYVVPKLAYRLILGLLYESKEIMTGCET